MQGRMKQHQLTKVEIDELLAKVEVGRIATLKSNGFPYVVPVHFVYIDEKIYIHGLSRGEKIDNLLRDNRVGFEIDVMDGIIPHETLVCDTNTAYRSVVLEGRATLVSVMEEKIKVLKAVVQKYTPQLSHLEFPEKMLKATGVIDITPTACTGKYYR